MDEQEKIQKEIRFVVEEYMAAISIEDIVPL
jgi:hypothetical protein